MTSLTTRPWLLGHFNWYWRPERCGLSSHFQRRRPGFQSQWHTKDSCREYASKMEPSTIQLLLSCSYATEKFSLWPFKFLKLVDFQRSNGKKVCLWLEENFFVWSFCVWPFGLRAFWPFGFLASCTYYLDHSCQVSHCNNLLNFALN